MTELERRLAALPAVAPALVVPPGRLVRPEGGGPPVLWLSDAAAPAGLWPQAASVFSTTGLWPLLVEGLRGEPARPWQAGELYPHPWVPGAGDAAEVLARRWGEGADPGAEDVDPEYLAAIEPFVAWPGPASPGTYRTDPEALAAQVADRLLAEGEHRLALVAVARGADALDAAGWSGDANVDPRLGDLSAVLRDWEVRFGVRLVGAGFDTVQLSVAAPPVTPDHALRVAADHLALCPDNVHQGAGSVREYAGELTGADRWSFWWD